METILDICGRMAYPAPVSEADLDAFFLMCDNASIKHNLLNEPCYHLSVKRRESPCRVCSGKGLVHPDGNPINAFEGSDHDVFVVCLHCKGTGVYRGTLVK